MSHIAALPVNFPRAPWDCMENCFHWRWRCHGILTAFPWRSYGDLGVSIELHGVPTAFYLAIACALIALSRQWYLHFVMQCCTDYRPYIMYTRMWIQCHDRTCMSYLILYMYASLFAAQAHCHVLWNCICHTSFSLDLVLRPTYSFIVHD